jgi:UDP-N-acetylglucosamine--N-acetylmuramyl-(pentapeptide) pyrophosphoryl-undecaprenol N-acetylglucosamine transferase
MKAIIVTGPSGGHIFPALSFLDSLKDKQIDAFLVLPRRHFVPAFNFDRYKVKYISTSTVTPSFNFKNFIALLKFFKGSLESLFIILEYRPDIIIGFGSLDSVPMIMLAWVFRIKTLIHEQNVIPGRANRLLTKFADRIAISFIETKDHLRISQGKITLTGNPLRRELIRADKDKALSFFGFDADRLTILVMGGSQGSHRINLSFLKAISQAQDKSKFQIIHITGPSDLDFLRDGYKNLGLKVKLFAFLGQMQYAYSAADLVVSRAGATTISELIYFKLATIFVPYPFAYEHQLSNAQVLKDKGCAVILNDGQLDGDGLRKILASLINNPQEIKSMAANYDDFLDADASSLLADLTLSL